MISRVFINYNQKASAADVKRNTKESLAWFRKRVRKDRATFNKVTEGLITPKFIPGEMITYEYDPKYKDTLPLYDKYPLIILLDRTKDGWYGANLHYLPPSLRQKIFESIITKRNLGAVKKFLESNEHTKHCLKRYLSKHVKSRPSKIPRSEWEIAIFLPFEGFQKQTAKQAWRKSK
jgi:hypothetical protein